MTAQATNDGRDNFTSICSECPEAEDLGGVTVGQKATVDVLRRHDRKRHLRTSRPYGSPRGVRDLPVAMATLAVAGASVEMRAGALGNIPDDADGRTERSVFHENNTETSTA
jgi:hypothetical protein